MILTVLATFLAVSLCSAGVFIEPLQTVYNYGDFLDANTNVISTSSASGHYTVDLICGSNLTIAVFNQFITTQANVEKPFQVETQLLAPQLRNVSQACNLRASYNGDLFSSSSFKMSKKINVESDLEFDELKPGNSIILSGKAIKESNAPLNGFIEVFITSLNLYKSGTVSEGIFNLSLTLPKNVKSGVHNVIVSVYDADNTGKKLNLGIQSHDVKVLQVLDKVEIIAEKENIKPGEKFSFLIDARDQAGDSITGQVSVVISEPNGLPFIKKVIKYGENQKVPFSLNNTPGYWSVVATIGSETKRKLFYLAETPEIQTSLINDSLIVTNIGNAEYAGPLEITIGSHVEVKQLNLKVGETQKFTLRAPDGTYSISVLEKGESQSLGNTFLTGRIVEVADLKQDLVNTLTDPFIWSLIALLFVFIVIFVQIRVRMKNKPSVTSSTPESSALSGWEVKKSPVLESPIKKDDMKDSRISSSVTSSLSWKPTNTPTKSGLRDITAVTTKPVSFANPQITTPFQTPAVNPFAGSHQGIRERAIVLAVRVSNTTNSAYVSQTINSALSIAQETGAKIYIDGECKIILFSPRLTRIADNENLAINAAKRIESLFVEHNRLYNEKISFGLGISDGDIISEIENNKFHFTSAGNIISLGKRIAQVAMMKLLLSDSVRKKAINIVKTEKDGQTGFWEVKRIVDRSSSRDFVDSFVKRNR